MARDSGAIEECLRNMNVGERASAGVDELLARIQHSMRRLNLCEAENRTLAQQRTLAQPCNQQQTLARPCNLILIPTGYLNGWLVRSYHFRNSLRRMFWTRKKDWADLKPCLKRRRIIVLL
jgi:hypothetical protein